MKDNRAMLEGQLERYETQLRSTSSFLKELNARMAEHGTDKAQVEEDLIEAENNAKYYESEIARVKKELGGAGQAPTARKAVDSVLPRTTKQGLGSLIISTISFAAGTLFGSKMKARQTGKDAPAGKAGKDSEK
jgi:septal ring factor EnvC (AmiA/AmiB activator)